MGAGPWKSSAKEREGQTKKGSKERGRRPTRTIEKVGRKDVVRPYPPHLPEILVVGEEIGEDTRGKQARLAWRAEWWGHGSFG